MGAGERSFMQFLTTCLVIRSVGIKDLIGKTRPKSKAVGFQNEQGQGRSQSRVQGRRQGLPN